MSLLTVNTESVREVSVRRLSKRCVPTDNCQNCLSNIQLVRDVYLQITAKIVCLRYPISIENFQRLSSLKLLSAYPAINGKQQSTSWTNLQQQRQIFNNKDKVLIKDLLNSSTPPSAPTKPPRYSNRIVPHTSTASPVKMSSFKFQSIFLGLLRDDVITTLCFYLHVKLQKRSAERWQMTWGIP